MLLVGAAQGVVDLGPIGERTEGIGDRGPATSYDVGEAELEVGVIEMSEHARACSSA